MLLVVIKFLEIKQGKLEGDCFEEIEIFIMNMDINGPLI